MGSLRRAVPACVLAALMLPISMVPTAAQAAPVPAGHLAFVTPAGVLKIVAVMSNGDTTDPVRLAPVTKVAAPKFVKVSDLVASADKSRLAWSEQIFKPSKKYGQVFVGARIAVRIMYSGKTITVHGSESPLGFAGHTLVVNGAYAKRLVMKPAPHLVRLAGDAYPVATYPKGVVDVAFADAGPNSAVDHERLRLTTFDGHHTLLHQYNVGKQYRNVTANVDAVSPDGRKLLVERGNHQDFDGLGNSSLFDTYGLGANHTRHQLGHYGSASAKWRLAGVTFVGPHDTPWLAIHDAPRMSTGGYYVVRGFVVRYAAGQWQQEGNQDIAVAGNTDGYVVVQQGEWRAVPNSDAGEYAPFPTGYALLRGPQGGHYMKTVKATELVWVVKTYKNAPEGR